MVGSLAMLIFSGLIRSLCLRSLAPFFVVLRRVFILLLRPLLIGGTTFFLIPWYKITHKEAKSFIKFVLSTSVFVTFLLLLLDLWNNPKGFRWSEHFSAALIAYGSAVGLFTAVLAIAFLTLSIVAPSLKIILDIFRYIGSQEYRVKIQSHLNGVIKWVSVARERARP
ncbi:MAG TPA: hypothetical protein VGK96_10175, partial [Candidatus Sulfotelmatobacter sp.]